MEIKTVSNVPAGVTMARYDNSWWVQADSVAALNELASKPQQQNKAIHDEHADPAQCPGLSAKQWDGVAKSAEAFEILKAGSWPEGVARVLENMKRLGLDRKPTNMRRARQWCDQGDELDIHKVYSGSLDTAWQRCRRRSVTSSRNITLLCNIAINGGVAAEALFWRGAAALIVSDALTDAGYNVEIEAVDMGRFAFRDNSHYCVATKVKHASSPLDLNALAVSLCLAAFMRRTGFMSYCAIPAPLKIDMGSACSYRSVVTTEMDNRPVILCEGIESLEEAERWVAKILADIEAQAIEI